MPPATATALLRPKQEGRPGCPFLGNIPFKRFIAPLLRMQQGAGIPCALHPFCANPGAKAPKMPPSRGSSPFRTSFCAHTAGRSGTKLSRVRCKRLTGKASNTLSPARPHPQKPWPCPFVHAARPPVRRKVPFRAPQTKNTSGTPFPGNASSQDAIITPQVSRTQQGRGFAPLCNTRYGFRQCTFPLVPVPWTGLPHAMAKTPSPRPCILLRGRGGCILLSATRRRQSCPPQSRPAPPNRPGR